MRNIIKTIFVVVLVVLVHQAQSQNQKLDNWNEGTITLKDQSQVSGLVNINFTTQNVRFIAQGTGTEQAFSPMQVNEINVLKNAYQERHVSLNIGDGQKFYLWLGESEEIAFLFHICGTTIEYQSYNNSSLNSCTNKGMFIPSSAQHNPNVNVLGFFGYFLGLTPDGKQYFFYKETSRERNMSRRKYLYTKRDMLDFFEQFDPQIKSYIKKKNLNYKKDLNSIITRVIR